MSPEDIDTMARTVWGEARGEPLEGKIAVAWVIKNRADNPGWWGTGIAGVCKQPWQFSCWNENDPNKDKLKTITPQNEMFRECLHVVAGVLSGNYLDNTKMANHYHAKGVTPVWARWATPNVTINKHLFYTLRSKS